MSNVEPFELLECNQTQMYWNGALETEHNNGIPSIVEIEFGAPVVVLRCPEGHIYAVPPEYVMKYTFGDFNIVGAGIFLGRSEKDVPIICVRKGERGAVR